MYETLALYIDGQFLSGDGRREPLKGGRLGLRSVGVNAGESSITRRGSPPTQ